MEYVKLEDLKKGQVVIVGELGVGKFEIAKVKNIRVHFKDWEKIDMKKGSIEGKENGIIEMNEISGGVNILDKDEIKKVKKIKNKIKMLEELEK